MSQKIIIEKRILKNLYLIQNLSTHQIAKIFKCDPSIIQKKLKENGIKLRNPKKKIEIPKEKLFDLYINKNLSTQKISKILGISSSSVYNKLRQDRIKIRPKRIMKIIKKDLSKMYVNERLSCSEIANKLGFDKVTVFNKLKSFNIKTRNLSEATTIFSKEKFDGSKELKSYMIGFRLGDLYVKTIDGNTIYLKSNTTKKEQVRLIKKIFGKYGHFYLKDYDGIYHLGSNLDRSFYFLLSKKDDIEEWILKDNKLFFAFLAGYTDAEGNFGISQNRARFRLGTYDKNILTKIKDKLNSLNINTRLNLEKIAQKGKYNSNFYRISVNEKNSLFKLIENIKPFIKHDKRYRDMMSCRNNILKRNKKYEDKFNLMGNKKTFYVTTPIYYPTAKPHIGTAYTTIAADVLARWHKLQGEEVFFLTGTDEHGQKLDEAAKKAGKSPKEYVDELVKEFKNAWKELNIEFDGFIRTTDKSHEETVKKIIKKISEKDDLYKREYEGLYCISCESYWTEKDLINEKCPSCGRNVQSIKENAYFFRLSKYQKDLLKLYEKNPNFILPKSKRNEIINRVQEGLKDISFTRSKFKWGVEFPLDKSYVLWVWADALINYLSGLDWPAGKNFKKFWPANIHLVGKDILWFHSVIWPAMLMSAGIPLPKTVFAHGWWVVNGEKMSKSKGNVIDPIKIIKKYGVDSFRYFLFRATPFGEDGDFSEQVLIERHNNELANKLGNLVSRVASLAEKYGIEKCENKLLKKLKLKEIENHFESYQLDRALNEIFAFIDACNEYIQSKKPWETHDKKVLYELVESIKKIGELLFPFIPETSEKIAKQFSGKNIKKGEILFKKI